MSPHHLVGSLIRALARADWTAAESLIEKLGQLRWVRGLELVGAAFTLAVQRRFDPPATPAAVADWVAVTRAHYPDTEHPLPALEMEVLIRAALGGPELVDSIPADILTAAEIFILGQLLRESPLSPTELDEFMDKAEGLAAEYR